MTDQEYVCVNCEQQSCESQDLESSGWREHDCLWYCPQCWDANKQQVARIKMFDVVRDNWQTLTDELLREHGSPDDEWEKLREKVREVWRATNA